MGHPFRTEGSAHRKTDDMRFKLKQNKYHNRKSVYRGIKFDSDLERDRYIYLEHLQDEGVIQNLRRQVEFELIPKQYEDVYVVMKTKTKWERQFREHPTTYRADFTYEIVDKMSLPPHICALRIEDTKGYKTPDYIIKRKLMRLQGNPISEITSPTQSLF